jgi:hypothetical protein
MKFRFKNRLKELKLNMFFNVKTNSILFLEFYLNYLKDFLQNKKGLHNPDDFNNNEISFH